MLNNKTYEMFHIDFDLIFDTGALLPVPEDYNFRFSNCILNSLDLTSVWGVFYFYFKSIATFFFKNKDFIASYFDIFEFDVIDKGKKVRNQYKNAIGRLSKKLEELFFNTEEILKNEIITDNKIKANYHGLNLIV